MAASADALIRQFYEFYNQRQIEEASSLFASDAVIEHAPFGRVLPGGGDGYRQSAERSFSAFPDAHVDVLHITSYGGGVYDVDLLATGTHRGVLDLGVYGRFEATGLRVRVPHREVLEIRDGLIVSASVTLDVNGLITQLSRGPA